MANFTIIGMGGFGLAIAVMLDKNGHKVTVWSAFEKEIEDIRRDGESVAKLKGIKIPTSIELTTNLDCVIDAEIVIFGVPTFAIRNVCKDIKNKISPETVIVNTSKGLEIGSLKRMSEVILEEIPNASVVVLTGPSHAEEVAIGIPTTVTVSSNNQSKAEFVQGIMSNDSFRIYINSDIIGCEIGGSLKNVIALSAGICDGMGLGDNTKAALMTRGLSEIARLGVALGGHLNTFAGLTGIGDLIVTCTSMHSRNRRAGILIGEGNSPEEAVEKVGTVEG